MKVAGLILALLPFLTSPLLALEYQGRSLDGRKLPAKAYYQRTGGVYNVFVLFEGNRATIYFAEGGQTTIQLKQSVITDLNEIQGMGRLGYIRVGNSVSIGLEQNQPTDDVGTPGPHGVNDIWRLRLSAQDLD
jgi:hypothetical protein